MQESDYQRLLELLIDVVEANKGIVAGQDDRVLDAEGLAVKFVFHAASALYLYRSTTLPELNASFFDAGSVNVVSRAALETFLVFHYIFIEPTTDQDRDYRYTAWRLAGLLERQQFPIWSAPAKAALAREANAIGPLMDRLKANATFATLTPKQQKNVLTGQWRLHSWTHIGRSAGLHDINAKALYAYLCGYAHAGHLSVLQLRQANVAMSQRSLCATSMNLVLIAMANMVRSYCTLFLKARIRLEQEPNRGSLVDVWIGVGSAGPEDVLDESGV
jgi:hypothetical protein